MTNWILENAGLSGWILEKILVLALILFLIVILGGLNRWLQEAVLYALVFIYIGVVIQDLYLINMIDWYLYLDIHTRCCGG